MHFIDVLYNKYYPLGVINRIKSRRKNRISNFTLLCGNCMGGYIYHQLGLEFQSPTINLMMLQPDFYKFILNLDYYLSLEFEEVTTPSGVPVGKLGDITVYFTHYDSFEDGVNSWKRRVSRIDRDNLYIVCTDRDGITADDIHSLKNVRCKKLVVFTAKKYNEPFCFQISQYEKNGEIGNILGKTISGKWRFERFFDYVAWLNSPDCVAESFRR